MGTSEHWRYRPGAITINVSWYGLDHHVSFYFLAIFGKQETNAASTILIISQWYDRWFKPRPGYLKINVDGSVRDGNATYWRLLMNDDGQWLWGYTGACGTCYFASLRWTHGYQGGFPSASAVGMF